MNNFCGALEWAFLIYALVLVCFARYTAYRVDRSLRNGNLGADIMPKPFRKEEQSYTALFTFKGFAAGTFLSGIGIIGILILLWILQKIA